MIAENLKAVPLFAELDDAELARVAEVAADRDVPAGTRLFTTGDPSDAFYVLAAGAVTIRIPASAVQEERVIALEPGSFFGEMGVLRGKARMADADVTADSKLIAIEQGDFDILMSVDASVAEKVNRAYMARAAAARATEEAAEEALKNPHTFLVIAAGDEVGASFLTANLAFKIRDLTGAGVLAIDLRTDTPKLHAYLGADETSEGLSAVLGGDLTGLNIRRGAVQLDQGVDMLADTGLHRSSPDADTIEKLIPAALEAYPYVIVDAHYDGSPAAEALARVCDTTQVVFRAEEKSIQEARRVADALKAQGLDGRIRFIINKWDDADGHDPEAIEYEINEELSGKVGLDVAMVKEALEAKEPVVRRNPRHPVSVQVTRLARQILSLPAGMMEKLRGLSVWKLLGV